MAKDSASYGHKLISSNSYQSLAFFVCTPVWVSLIFAASRAEQAVNDSSYSSYLHCTFTFTYKINISLIRQGLVQMLLDKQVDLQLCLFL